MWKSVASNALSLFVVILAGLVGLVAWGQREFKAEGPLETAMCLRVEPGARIETVTRTLEQQGAISNGYIFKVGARYTERDDKLRFGNFLVPAGATMDDILTLATRGGANSCGTEVRYLISVTGAEIRVREMDLVNNAFTEVLRFDPSEGEPPAEYTELREQPDLPYSVVVAEGATSWHIVDALNKVDFLEGEVAEVPAEGVLAPDSYELRAGADRNALLEDMQLRQSLILEAAWAERAEGLPVETPEEALILASIVEKETGIPEERRRVASVFVNRLNAGMRLQTDPTVIYGITEGKQPLGRGLRQSELRAETPYNTYVIDGLPPTPIANPGRASIEAALNPEETDLVYFVADGTGGHAFARTLDEHNANVRRWREIEASAPQ